MIYSNSTILYSVYSLFNIIINLIIHLPLLFSFFCHFFRFFYEQIHFLSFFHWLFISFVPLSFIRRLFLKSDYRNPHLWVQILLIRLSRYFLLYFPKNLTFFLQTPIYSVALDPVSYRVTYAEIFFRVLAPSHHLLFIPFRCYCILY